FFLQWQQVNRTGTDTECAVKHRTGNRNSENKQKQKTGASKTAQYGRMSGRRRSTKGYREMDPNLAQSGTALQHAPSIDGSWLDLSHKMPPEHLELIRWE